nr:hypothetical protein [Nocardioides panacis]
MLHRVPQVDDLVDEAAALRVVHRTVGLGDQHLGDVLARAGEGDPDAGGQGQRGAGGRERRGERAADPVGEHLHVPQVVEVLAQQHELVAVQPGQGVARPQQPGQPTTHPAQQLVAHLVAVRVVDLLEAVEVDEQDRRLGAGALRTTAGLLDPFLQQEPVRQAGQGVVHGQVLEPGMAAGGLLAGPGVEQVGRGHVREGLGDLHGVAAEVTRGSAVQVEGTEAAVRVAQREREDRREARLHRGRPELREAVVHTQVGDGHRAARLEGEHARALGQVGLQPLEQQRGLVRRGDVARADPGVDQRDPGGGDRQDVDDPFDQVVQDGREGEVGRERERQLAEDR